MLAFIYLALVLGAVRARSASLETARSRCRRIVTVNLPDWVGPVVHYILFEGLPGTLKVSRGAVVGSVVIGVTLGTLITIDFRPLRTLIRLYIELWRGLPILVTVFLVYFGLPVAVSGDRVWRAAVHHDRARAVGERTGRRGHAGGRASIAREQHEAASALGFGWGGRHAHVILPQALRRLLPPFVSIVVNLVQNSTLAQVIGGLELLEAAERQNERLTAVPPIGLGEIKAFQIFGFVMILFFLISFPLTRLAAHLEKRLS